MKRPRRPAKKIARKAVRKKRQTKAQKAAQREAELHAKFRKVDPFYLNPGLIPAGWAYQWSTYVDPHSGWRPVPFSRHAHDFPKVAQTASGFITIKGLTLAEIPAEHVKAELSRGVDKARAMMADHDRALGHEAGGKGFWIMPESWIASYTAEEASAINPPDPAGPPVEVLIGLTMKVPARWAEAAAYLKLTLEEYTRRRVVMGRPILGCMDPFATEAVYETVALNYQPKEI